MSSDLLNKYYPGGAPIIIQVAFKHGYGASILDLNKKVYFNQELSISPVILEAIQAVCLVSCENSYCVVMHARGLISQGFTLDDIQRLVRFQELPKWVERREIWEPSLRRIATIFREPEVASHLYKSLLEFHSVDEQEEIGGIVAFSLLHKFLLEFYKDEIRIDDEPILFKTIDCGEELIAFFRNQPNEGQAVYTICCMCKDLRGKDGWIPVESALAGIPADATFSHGLCKSCFTRLYSDMETSS